MGLFNYFRGAVDVDETIRKKLVEYIFGVIQDRDRRIRVEDAVSAAATIVAERCIEVAGDFPLRDHVLAPGSRAFSTRANELICGDETISPAPAESIVGILRRRLDRNLYADAEFPDLAEVFSGFAARIGDPADWGKVPLSVPGDNFPFLMPLQVGYQTRTKVDEILAHIRDDKARCLRIATESLADILTQVASAIDHKVVLTLAIETINGMAKTAPMTERAMREVQDGKA